MSVFSLLQFYVLQVHACFMRADTCMVNGTPTRRVISDSTVVTYFLCRRLCCNCRQILRYKDALSCWKSVIGFFISCQQPAAPPWTAGICVRLIKKPIALKNDVIDILIHNTVIDLVFSTKTGCSKQSLRRGNCVKNRCM